MPETRNGVKVPGKCPECGADLTAAASVVYDRAIHAVSHAVHDGQGGYVLDERGTNAADGSGEDFMGEYSARCTACGHVLEEQSIDWG